MTLDGLILRWADRAPDRTAVITLDRRYSYRALSQTARRHARALQALGAGRGDRLVVMLEPGFEAVALLCACARLGVVWVPVSPENPGARTAVVVAAVTPAAFVGSPATLDLVRASVPNLDVPVGLVRDDTLVWDPSARSLPVPRDRPPVLDIDPAYVIFTSASTGQPKGIVMPHRSACGFLEALIAFNSLSRDAVVGSYAPVQFDFWLLDTISALGSGAAIAYIPRSSLYQPKRVARHMRSLGVTQVNGVPAIWSLLMRHAQAEVEAIGSLQSVLVGGDAVALSVLRELQGLMPHLRIIHIFGQTESIACSFSDVPNSLPPGLSRLTFGHGHPVVELLNIDERGNAIVEPHAVGELYLRSDTLFTGYWDDVEATRAALEHPERWAPAAGRGVGVTFGLGRHSCLGRSLAMAELLEVAAFLSDAGFRSSCVVRCPAPRGTTFRRPDVVLVRGCTPGSQSPA